MTFVLFYKYVVSCPCRSWCLQEGCRRCIRQSSKDTPFAWFDRAQCRWNGWILALSRGLAYWHCDGESSQGRHSPCQWHTRDGWHTRFLPIYMQRWVHKQASSRRYKQEYWCSRREPGRWLWLLLALFLQWCQREEPWRLQVCCRIDLPVTRCKVNAFICYCQTFNGFLFFFIGLISFS